MRPFLGFDLAEVKPDRPDLRDRIYEPSLRPVRRKLDPPAKLRQTIHKLVRNQLDGNEASSSSCAAQALCSVIDILRMGDAAWSWDYRDPKVSAEMLFECARGIEADEKGEKAPAQGLSDLRAAIKAVYYNGICTERDFGNKDAIERGKSAREIPLGAYYRLRPILNDYHAALNDVGVIFAAAEIHDGWHPDLVSQHEGRIVVQTNAGYGGHAFVIVGYDEEGFLILNSWGSSWGGYRQWPGIAHWSYRDWAERILDGWVLRLGVPTPASFEVSIGEHGLGPFLSGSIGNTTPPRYNLLGYYIHLDDGDFVRVGPFPSDIDSIRTTVGLLNGLSSSSGRHKYTKLLLWIAGGEESTNEAVSAAISAKPYWRQQGVYPLTVLWCSDFFESTQPVLNQIFQTARERVGTAGDALDRQIEIATRRIGRAFWRDIKDSAKRAARKSDGQSQRGGGMYAAFEDLLILDPEIEIHVVAEAAGALLMGELLNTLSENEEEEKIGRIATITLLAPSCLRAPYEDALRKWSRLRRRKALLLVPNKGAKLKVGLYQRSILDLVERSFEEEVSGKAAIMGTERGAQDAKRHLGDVMLVRRLDESDAGNSTGKLRVLTFGERPFSKITSYWCGRSSGASDSGVNRMTVKIGGNDGQKKSKALAGSRRRARQPRREDRSRVPA